jgi:tetratricopeptide (TPR) repeat protein
VRSTAVEKLRVILELVLAASTAFVQPHLQVTTQSPQAQAAFDRGLFLYYAYDGDDAARAFEQAAQLDPRLAMAYWGIALADGPDLNTPLTEDRFTNASRAMKKTGTLAANASPLEQHLITAMVLRYQGSFANASADDQAYRAAMRALTASTQNQTVELLTAEALLEHGGLSWQQGMLASQDSRDGLTLVERALRDDPSSVMANHLCIHLYDLAPDRAPALPCAQRLDAQTFPPQAEHLAHMPAHFWIETGNYTAALRSSERAYALLTQVRADHPNDEHTERYEKHDVAVGYSAAMMLGNYASAQQWSRRMSAAFGSNFDPVTALRFGHYDAAYAADGNEFAGVDVRGLAALHLGRVSDAKTLAAHLPAQNAPRGYLPQLFLAELAEADGKYDDAEHLLEQGVANQQSGFSGELIPLIPAGEALGFLRLRRGDPSGAVTAFTDTLAAYPNDPRALFGLAQALEASSKPADAAATRARFKNEWEGADTTVGDALP